MRPKPIWLALLLGKTLLKALKLSLIATLYLLALASLLAIASTMLHSEALPHGCTIELVETPDFVPVWFLQTWYQVGAERFTHILSVRPVTEKDSLDKARKECLSWAKNFKEKSAEFKPKQDAPKDTQKRAEL